MTVERWKSRSRRGSEGGRKGTTTGTAIVSIAPVAGSQALVCEDCERIDEWVPGEHRDAEGRVCKGPETQRQRQRQRQIHGEAMEGFRPMRQH